MGRILLAIVLIAILVLLAWYFLAGPGRSLVEAAGLSTDEPLLPEMPIAGYTRVIQHSIP